MQLGHQRGAEGNARGEARTARIGTRVFEADGGLVPLGNRLHYGEAEAAAGRDVAWKAMEALEDPLALGDRDSRPAVDHGELDAMPGLANGRGDGGAGGRIAKGVVDQVGDE